MADETVNEPVEPTDRPVEEDGGTVEEHYREMTKKGAETEGEGRISDRVSGDGKPAES